LPDVARQAGVLLQNPLAQQDAEYRRMIIDWGRRQIEQEYPLDAVFAPLNPIRRKLALMEWDRVIRTNGKELRGIVAGAAVSELEFQLQRRQQHILAQDAEELREKATLFDAEVRFRETKRLADEEHARTKELIRLQHELGQEAEDNASRRRIEEKITETEQAISTLLIEAIVKASGLTKPEEVIRATSLVHAEIRRIRHDPDLTADEQHLHIKSLLDTLPQMLRTSARTYDI
jgi:hypothetical protein